MKKSVKQDPKVVEILVQKLKGEMMDFAPMLNAKSLKNRKQKNVKVPLFEYSTCITFGLNPDNPKWLKKVRAFVKFHYKDLIKDKRLNIKTQ